MALSNLGIFHTIIGVIAIGSAVVSFVRYRKIDLAKWSGKLYFYGTAITAVTALGLSKTGDFNAGHIFSILILILVLIAFFLFKKRQDNNRARYFETFLLSFSLFLSLVPTVNETFTRIPVGHPWAKDPTDPLIGKTLLLLFILLIAGSTYQYIIQRRINKSKDGPEI